MKYKGIIFDFNGTLFYDTPFHNIAWSYMVKKITGHEIDNELKQKMHGKNNKDILYCIDEKMSEQENKEYSLKKEEIYRAICLEHPDDLHLINGATQLFDYLKEHHIPFTIASASIKENIDFFFEVFSLSQWFDKDTIVYDDGHYRNKEDMFLEASHRLNIDIKDAMIIEDSLTGITHALNVQAGSVVAIGPKEKHRELKKLGVDTCISDYTELKIEV